MANFNQHEIIIKINQYLTYKNRSLTLSSGYCHGLVLLWLYKISVGQELWFYNIIQKIADCHSGEDFDEIEWDIERFISYIEWLQHSNLYLPGVNQLDVDKLTELPKDLSLSFLFHHTELNNILPLILKENKLILISGPDHSIGVYIKDNNVHVLDPKYNKIRPKIINDTILLKFEIIKCLFQRDYLPSCRLPLEFMVLSNPDKIDKHYKYQDMTLLYAKLIKDCRDINKPGLDGITNIHLACETGNEVEVKQLLKAGADPNQTCKDEWAPLHVASLRGDVSIVRLLLKFGAYPYRVTHQGMKPIDIAKEAGHEDIIQLLS